MSRKQKLKRAYINVGYPRHADILSLTGRFGIAGKCASYDLILAMSDASNGIIDKDAFLYTAKLNEVADPEAFLAYCLDKGIFIQCGDGYSNTHVIKDQESYAKTLDEDRERKGIRPEKNRNPTGVRPEKDRNLDIDIDNEFDLDPDLNKLDVRLPEFIDPKITSALGRWRQHRALLGRPFDQMALDSLINLYAGRADELADDIDHSISNGWKTLNAKPRDPPKARAGPDKPKHNASVQKALDLAAKYEAEGV